MIILIQYVPKEQIQMVREQSASFNPNQQLFLDTLATFLTAQTTLTKKDIIDLIDQANDAGAPDFANLLNSLVDKPYSEIAKIPLNTSEKFYSANEFADICGVSVQLVRRECDKKNIQATKGKKNSWIISEKQFGNPLCQRWLKNKQMMWSNIKDAKEVLKESDAFIQNMKKIEEDRKK
ncbi:hypothetical protein VQL36_20705 [Chengkuizengella sp. SCS-71B]|uniref:hypothetical protein n=1 Tax=Chengkuizengella sp. SCS-71B TaxID=3115290 RepID=UPI0032C21D32